MLIHCLEPGLYRNTTGAVLDRQALAAIASAQQLDPVTVVLPLRYCMVNELAVAGHERRYLAKTLPWRFEEQLMEPVESLHFAMTALASGRAQVTAVSRHWLQAVLADLSIAGIHPLAAISELELLPWQDQEWTLWYMPESDKQPAYCLLRHGQHRGLVCGMFNVGVILQSLADEQAALPRRIQLFAPGSLAAELQSRLPPSMQGLVQARQQRWQDLPPVICNVLQGEFAPALPWGRWWRQWRMVAVLLLALFLADVALVGAEAWRLQNSNDGLRLSIDDEVGRVLPGAVLADPLLQMRRAVVASGGGDHGGLLSMLTRMSPAFTPATGIIVQSFDYNQDSGELQLVIESSGFAAVESLRSRLQAQGLQAELLGSSSDGLLSRSRLRVKA